MPTWPRVIIALTKACCVFANPLVMKKGVYNSISRFFKSTFVVSVCTIRHLQFWQYVHCTCKNELLKCQQSMRSLFWNSVDIVDSVHRVCWFAKSFCAFKTTKIEMFFSLLFVMNYVRMSFAHVQLVSIHCKWDGKIIEFFA